VARERKKAGKRSHAPKPEREAAPEHDHAPGPRAFWSGTITFGLVSVPVDLFPAVRARRAPLRMLGADGEPLARRYVCSADGKPLGNEDIVRGYEWPDGSFTVVSDEELDALAPRKSRDIDLRRFVARSEIPPELLERSYLLAPAGDSTKAYHLLTAAMERGGRAGIATFVMHGKEYLAAIFAEGGLLRAATMRFPDELRSPQDVGLPEVPRVAPEQRKKIATELAKLETDDVDRAALEDDYTAALLQLAEKKRAAGRDVVEIAEAPAADEEGMADVIDIMSVLKDRMGTSRGPARAHTAPQQKRADALAASSKKELYERAQELNVPNRSRMTRDELIAAIRAAGYEQSAAS
jgi:DNA end-binding protein Ku